MERPLGSGGMASVFLVRAAGGEARALKVLAQGFSESARERLLREGRVQSSLDHPNILAVLEVVEDGGQLGLVMEYIQGPTLAELLAAGRPELEQADALAQGVLAGVSAAHRAGAVHRDLKPANVLLQPAPDGDGFVPRVADFGLVKVLAEDTESLEVLTRTGCAMGTASYMAPEQIKDAARVDQRADIFSLGAILYELATGSMAFSGPDIFSVWQSILKGRYPPPGSLRPELPPRMVRAIEGALVPKAGERIPDCEALLRVWRGEEVPEPARTVAPHAAPISTDTFDLDAPQPAHRAETGRAQVSDTFGFAPAPPVPAFVASGPPALPAAARLLADAVAAAEWTAWDLEVGATGHAPGARYVELEAEVERTGRGKLPAWLAGFGGGQWRREPSLSRALTRSDAPFTLVVGPAGAGKSMALRAAGRALLEEGREQALAVYLPLQRLEAVGSEMSAEPVRRLVAATMLKAGLPPPWEHGWPADARWVFLFDGFDEIPELLSSTWRDARVQACMEALHRFTLTVPGARGVVATRPLRGQGRLRWPEVRVLPLSEERARAFIQQRLHSERMVDAAAGWLAGGSRSQRAAGQNPLLLTLLLGFVGRHSRPPGSLFELFEDTVSQRLGAAEERLSTGGSGAASGVDRDMVGRVAAAAGYCMASDEALGLEVTLSALTGAIRREAPLLASRVPAALAALAEAGLGRLREREGAGGETAFGFSHRRLQEYFAACALISGDFPQPPALLSDYRWRETAVMLLQTRPIADLSPLLAQSTARLEASARALGAAGRGADDSPLSTADPLWGEAVEPSLHTLGILQDGLGARLEDAPPELRAAAGALSRRVLSGGGPIERHQLLEVMGVAPEPVQREALQGVLRVRSLWSLERALQQASYLPELGPELERAFREFLLLLYLEGRLRRQRASLRTWLSRLPHPQGLLESLDLLSWVRAIDAASGLLVAGALTALAPPDDRGLVLSLCLLTVWSLWVGERPFVRKAAENELRIRPHLRPTTTMAPLGLRWGFLGFCTVTLTADRLDLGLLGATALSPLLHWSPFAMTAALTGKLTARRWWPLLPLLTPLVHGLELLKLLGLPLLFGVMGVAFIFVLVEGAGGGLGKWLFYAPVFGLLGLIALHLAPLQLDRLLDYAALRRLGRLPRGSLDGAGLLQELGNLRTAWGRQELLTLTHREGLLPHSAEHRQLLAELAGGVEALLEGHWRARTAGHWLVRLLNPQRTVPLSTWRGLLGRAPLPAPTPAGLLAARGGEREWSREALDALYRLHESLT